MTDQQQQSRNSRPVWVALLLGLLAFTPDFANAGTQAGKQTMIYEVYAGGIHALQAELTIDLGKPGRFNIDLFAKTRGLLGKLAPWQGTFESHGWIEKDGHLQPELHKSTATWRDESEVKEYKYGRDGSFKELVSIEHNKPARSEIPEAELTNQTVDALTATLQVMRSIARGEKCDGSSDVFDGRRRFAQVFHTKGTEQLERTKYNIYEGTAQKCTLEVQPKGGLWHKKPRGWMSIQEQGRAKGTMPTLWVAKLSEGEPAVPVKLLVKTDYGALYMHLTEYHGPETMLIAEKRLENQGEMEQ